MDVEHDGCQVPSRAEITYNGIASEGIYIEGSFNYVLRNLDCRTSYVVVIELRGNKGELLDSYQVESATSEGKVKMIIPRFACLNHSRYRVSMNLFA